MTIPASRCIHLQAFLRHTFSVVVVFPLMARTLSHILAVHGL